MNGWWTTLWEHAFWPVPWVAALLITVIAAASDWRTRRIPNVLTFPAFLAGLAFACFVGGLAGLADSLAGALLAMLPFVLLFVFAGGGAGDAKLMAAIGAWVGVVGGFVTLASVMIAGGLVAVGLVISQRNGRAVFANVVWIFDSLRAALFGNREARQSYVLPAVESLHVMPYGLAIFVGTCIASGGAWLWHA
jgi:prepilin peptidase CpaA